MVAIADIDDDLDADYQSGPFCQHYSDPVECAVKCAKCGHTCPEHGGEANEPCHESECDCLGWVEPD